jgi:hypothetical protein
MRPWTLVRAHLGYGIQHGAPADQVTELRRELAVSRLAYSIERLLTSDLPPTDAQCCELADMLVRGR